MRKTLLLAGVACLLAANASAAELNPYVSGKLTYSDISYNGTNVWKTGVGKDKLSDDVLGGSVAAGLSMMAPGGAVRGELEYNLNGEAKKSMGVTSANIPGEMKLRSQSLMLNAYYDINTNSAFTPYVGAGIGFAKVKAKLTSSVMNTNADSTKMAWQVGAGVAYALNDNVAIDLGYRYTDMGEYSKPLGVDNTYKLDVHSHEVLLGARYSF